MIPPRLKRAVESALVQSGVLALGRALMRRQGLILAYHNIVPDGSQVRGDGSLHLPRQHFAAQLDHLVETCEVVGLEELLSGSAPSRRPRVAITFDDAYRGAVTAGVAELARRELPATIFVAPAFVGGRSFWWDVLVDGRGDGVPPAFRSLALQRYRGEDAVVRKYAVQDGLWERTPDAHVLTATEDELRLAAATPGITLGSHSWGHPNLSELSVEELRSELTEPLRWLRERFDPVVPWLTYPYGLSSEVVKQVAAEAGYAAALRVAGGWLPAGQPDRYALPRLNVPAGLSKDGFALRLAGMFAGDPS